MTNGPAGTSPEDDPQATSHDGEAPALPGATDADVTTSAATSAVVPDADLTSVAAADVDSPARAVAASRTSHGATASSALPASAGVAISDKDDDEPGADGTGDADGSDGEGSTAPDGKRPRSFWRELPVLVVVALVLAFLIKSFLVQAFYIPSESMEDTLLIGDRVLVNKLAYRIGDVERGDVIVFDGTDSFDAGTKITEPSGNVVTRSIKKVASSFGLAPGSDNDYIKRVIGIGGDHVVCCDDKGHITVNGTALAPEDYLFPGDEPSNTPFDITVPADRVWVMGDHRSRSEDSRAHLGNPGGGTVPVDHIVGRAFVIVWPFNRFDTLTRPADFDKIAAASP